MSGSSVLLAILLEFHYQDQMKEALKTIATTGFAVFLFSIFSENEFPSPVTEVAAAPVGVDYIYRVVNSQEMDSIGFTSVAEQTGILPDEDGKMDLPGEMLLKPSLLPLTIQAIEKEGWIFVCVTGDNHYIFRK